VDGVGGWSVRPLSGQVQRSIGGYGARWGFYGAPESWAGVALRRCRRAMQTRVKNIARGVLVHGNGARALGMLGGSVASNRHVRGGVHVAARAVLIQGIDHGGQHESGGEVT
jgi:hypothetical protein